jgi:hypothetical protein
MQKNMNYLFTIEYSVFIKEIGSIICASFQHGKFPGINEKDKILICPPNGEQIETYVESFPMLNFKTEPGYLHFSILLPKNIKNVDNFVEGTKIYTIA